MFYYYNSGIVAYIHLAMFSLKGTRHNYRTDLFFSFETYQRSGIQYMQPSLQL